MGGRTFPLHRHNRKSTGPMNSLQTSDEGGTPFSGLQFDRVGLSFEKG